MIQRDIDLIMPQEIAERFEEFVNLNLSFLAVTTPDKNGDCEVHLRFRQNQEKQWLTQGFITGRQEGLQQGRSEVFDRLRCNSS